MLHNIYFPKNSFPRFAHFISKICMFFSQDSHVFISRFVQFKCTRSHNQPAAAAAAAVIGCGCGRSSGNHLTQAFESGHGSFEFSYKFNLNVCSIHCQKVFQTCKCLRFNKFRFKISHFITHNVNVACTLQCTGK